MWNSFRCAPAVQRLYLVAVMTVAMLLMLNRELGLALLSLVLISEVLDYRKKA